MTQQDIATFGRIALSLALVSFAALSLYFAHDLFVRGIGTDAARLKISMLGFTIAPGTVGTGFLAISAIAIYVANSVKPLIQRPK